MRREKSYRGISARLAVRYLENLGGKRVGESEISGDSWRANLSVEKIDIGPSLSLTEVTVVFEGEERVLDPLIEQFSQKAMRAGG